MKPIAIAVVASETYLSGLIALSYSLQLNGKIPWDLVDLILLTPDVELHRSHGRPEISAGRHGLLWKVREVAIGDYNKITAFSQPRFKGAWHKLDALLLHHSRVIVMDADMLCLGSIAELCNLDDLHAEICMAPDHGIKRAQIREGKLVHNSGLIVINVPHSMARREIRRILIDRGETEQSFDGGDMGALHCLFVDGLLNIGTLPEHFNVSKRTYKYHPEQWAALKGDDIQDDIRLLHFTGIKPWQHHTADDPGYENLETLWHNYYNLGNSNERVDKTVVGSPLLAVP